ncbi:hypothetical protein V6Z11_D06G074000 [Gossypium hirsutum]
MYKETMIGDVEKMLAVGLIWGATNAAMRRGALLWDRYLKSTPNSGDPPRKFDQKLLNSLSNWLTLLLFWQYSIPFFINLSASATFFAILGQAPISLAVPVTNATTFAATAVFGILLGEETRIGHALLVIDHEVLSDPIQLTHLATAQLTETRGSPPVSWGFGGTLIDTHWPIPLASSCPEPAESGNER